MKQNHLYTFNIVMAVVLTIVLAGTVFAGGSAEKATSRRATTMKP